MVRRSVLRHLVLLVFLVALGSCVGPGQPEKDECCLQAWEPAANETRPVLIERVELVRPSDIPDEWFWGSACICATLSEEGEIKEPRIGYTNNPRLSGPALRNVVKWKYQPAARDGIPIAVPLKISLALSRGSRPAQKAKPSRYGTD